MIIIDYFAHRYSIDVGNLHIDGSMMGGRDISMDRDGRGGHIDGSMMGGRDISMDHDGRGGHIDGS